ncbi:hypothetical protein LTR37_015689 [Vermiconidia calcicola]|uniref:Uncharacterized protein n=1 Tax=Vermiconidia calcicola TaxID=1690605 RepID=A0ACC3MQE4_9PEZI|nr:hypothetical protein LTR37_015689 [Vermiconidia calcicola]
MSSSEMDIRNQIDANVATMYFLFDPDSTSRADNAIAITKQRGTGNKGQTKPQYHGFVLLDKNMNFVMGSGRDEPEGALQGLFDTTCEALQAMLQNRLDQPEAKASWTPNGGQYRAE